MARPDPGYGGKRNSAPTAVRDTCNNKVAVHGPDEPSLFLVATRSRVIWLSFGSIAKLLFSSS